MSSPRDPITIEHTRNGYIVAFGCPKKLIRLITDSEDEVLALVQMIFDMFENDSYEDVANEWEKWAHKERANR